ncbi:hypothetical protein HanIR_Chr07g0334461 [Helianthus annuus]|nr:hypothetical protein HanIR_Chr07g0334461 [Helianthus annuus]
MDSWTKVGTYTNYDNSLWERVFNLFLHSPTRDNPYVRGREDSLCFSTLQMCPLSRKVQKHE